MPAETWTDDSLNHSLTEKKRKEKKRKKKLFDMNSALECLLATARIVRLVSTHSKDGPSFFKQDK